MAGDETSYIRTGEAARRLGVTPDTVLKWIHRGKVQAVSTAGGHHRIPAAEMRRLTGEKERWERAGGGVKCWEYFSQAGEVREECQECAAYRFRAARCYEVHEAVGSGCGTARLCDGACGACPYYRQAHGLRLRVLVVSRDAAWRAALVAGMEQQLEVEFAGGVYEAAGAIGAFLPGVVVLDGALPAGELEMLKAEIAKDRRIPWGRVIVASGADGRASVMAGLEPLLRGPEAEET